LFAVDTPEYDEFHRVFNEKADMPSASEPTKTGIEPAAKYLCDAASVRDPGVLRGTPRVRQMHVGRVHSSVAS
jgi:hypothetical protein